MSVVGVDACARGWIAVVLPSSGPPRGVFAASLSALSEAVPDAQAYGLDIPIGLPDVARHPDGLRPPMSEPVPSLASPARRSSSRRSA